MNFPYESQYELCDLCFYRAVKHSCPKKIQYKYFGKENSLKACRKHVRYSVVYAFVACCNGDLDKCNKEWLLPLIGCAVTPEDWKTLIAMRGAEEI